MTTERIASYRREGYLILRGVFPPEVIATLAADVQRVCRERSDLINADNMRVRFKPHCESNEPLLEVLDPISDLSPAATFAMTSPVAGLNVSNVFPESASTHFPPIKFFVCRTLGGAIRAVIVATMAVPLVRCRE